MTGMTLQGHPSGMAPKSRESPSCSSTEVKSGTGPQLAGPLPCGRNLGAKEPTRFVWVMVGDHQKSGGASWAGGLPLGERLGREQATRSALWGPTEEGWGLAVKGLAGPVTVSGFLLEAVGATGEC